MKFEVPQRQQLASERTSLTLFAPAPSTVSCVPFPLLLRRHSVPETGFWGTEGIFGARKPPSGVRDAFSDALGAQKQAFPVQKGYSVPKKASCGTRRIRSTRCAKTGFSGTKRIFGARKPPSGVRDASSEALCLSLKKVDSQQRVNNGVFTHSETVQLL